MQASWTSDFLRETLLNAPEGGSILAWSAKLIDFLARHKPDHEIQILGVSRIPRMPNLLVGSSSETFLANGPMLVTVTPKTAELFLAPTDPGVRLLQEEFPMMVRYDLDGAERRIDLSFYEAICFDDVNASIILGLTLTESELGDFLNPQEISELVPMIRSQAIPLVEREQYRLHMRRMEDDMSAMTTVMRESNPDLAKLSGFGFHQASSMEKDAATWDPEFVQYIARELRQSHQELLNIATMAMEMSRTSMGSPQMFDATQRVFTAAKGEFSMIRNLASLAALSSRDVKPRTQAFPLPGFLQEIYPRALEAASPRQARVTLDETTRNIYVTADRETLLGMIDRLVLHCLEAAGARNIWITTSDRGEYCPEGMVMLEIRDDGAIDDSVPAYKLLDRVSLIQIQHPRVKRGGGVLYQMLDLYMTKSGGKMNIKYHMDGGLCVQLMLPLVSRAELERIKAGEIG